MHHESTPFPSILHFLHAALPTNLAPRYAIKRPAYHLYASTHMPKGPHITEEWILEKEWLISELYRRSLRLSRIHTPMKRQLVDNTHV